MAAGGEAPVDPAVLARAVDQMEQLDRMRISLASTLEGSTEEPTMDTMREVCMPVGKRAMAIGQENGWTVRQVASKSRNPDHAPAGAQETEVIDLLVSEESEGVAALSSDLGKDIMMRADATFGREKYDIVLM